MIYTGFSSLVISFIGFPEISGVRRKKKESTDFRSFTRPPGASLYVCMYVSMYVCTKLLYGVLPYTEFCKAISVELCEVRW